MADEQKPKKSKKPIEPKADAVAGKKAPPAEAAAPAPAPRPQTKSTKIPKLLKKNKSGLPRRQKKAQQKEAARQSKV
jgi:hypothetical protein